LGAIGEKTTAWNYSLPDGTNTPRQLSDLSGDITLTSRYTPWGDTLELNGNGNLTFGYFGGVMDAATGLLYVGNGQYYDPATGRFLTRNVNPNSTNPYTPWNPIGAIVGPLGVVALFFGRRKKGSKWGTFLVLLLVVGSVGMTLSACNTTAAGYNITATPSPTQPNTYNVTATPITVPSSTPSPTDTPLPTITATCTLTPSPIPTTDDDYKSIIEARFGILISDDTGTWPTAHIQIVYSALLKIDDALHGTLKSLLGTTTKKFNHDWSAKYGGTTFKVPEEKINFRASQGNSHFPHQLIYHEMGHLLDNAQGDKYTDALDQTIVYTGYPNQTGERVMGRDCPDNQYGDACKTPPYNRIDGLGYIQYNVISDPSGYNAETEMHPRSMDGGNTAIEEWGDLFANFVAGNFDSSGVGRAKYNWVHDQLFGG